LQDASLLRFLVDMRGADVDDRQVNTCGTSICLKTGFHNEKKV
jgi:hypothetical protein